MLLVTLKVNVRGALPCRDDATFNLAIFTLFTQSYIIQTFYVKFDSNEPLVTSPRNTGRGIQKREVEDLRRA